MREIFNIDVLSRIRPRGKTNNLLHGFAEPADGDGGDDLLPDQGTHTKQNAPRGGRDST